MSSLALQVHAPQSASNGGRLVAADGRTLPLKAAALTADAKGGIVRVVLEQKFVNPYAEPLHVTYQMPLPADGAVSGFAFRIGEDRIVGQVDTKKQARERFEEAILDGRTAAILDQERSSLFTQQVGNIPPHTEVVAELTIDQKLLWLPDGAWEWRFPTVVAPRYLGEPGRVVDAAAVTVDVADQELPITLSLKMAIRDQISARPFSPSHPLHAAQGLGRHDVTFGDEAGVALDRDVVVRWQAAGLSVGAELDVARPITGDPSDSGFGLLTLVPPTAAVKMAKVPRDLIVLLDTSGSMSGQPLDQARRVVSAMIDTLDDHDRLELIEFSNEPRRWKWRAQEASLKHKEAAQAWLRGLQAGGGTEMASGMIEALKPLRKDAQRQVVLITDGLIGSEHEVLNAIIHKLPAGSRVHTVGVGSGVNRSLTMPAARAGRGVEIVIGLGEDAEVSARRLLARTTAPLVTEVEVSGSALVAVAPEHPMDLFAGAPALLCLKLHPSGGELVVRGKTAEGNYLERLTVKPVERGEGSAAVATLFGRECVEDLETRAAAGENNRGEIDRQVEKLGLQFQISTRLTSWVAVSKTQTVDPTAARRKQTVPQNLAYGMSAEGMGLRQGAMPQPVMAGAPMGAGGAERKREVAKGAFFSVARRASPAPAGRATGAPPAQPPRDVDDEVRADEGAAPQEEQVRAELDRLVSAKDGPAKAKKVAAEAILAVLEIAARLLLLKNGKMAVELSFAEATVWAPLSVVVELSDGMRVAVEVDATRTTTPQTVSAGVTVTLALKVPASFSGVPVRIHLTSGHQALVLAL